MIAQTNVPTYYLVCHVVILLNTNSTLWSQQQCVWEGGRGGSEDSYIHNNTTLATVSRQLCSRLTPKFCWKDSLSGALPVRCPSRAAVPRAAPRSTPSPTILSISLPLPLSFWSRPVTQKRPAFILHVRTQGKVHARCIAKSCRSEDLLGP